MSDPESSSGDWQSAVSEATEHVQQRREAEGEAAARQRPKSEGPKIAVAFALLAAVLVWNVTVLTAPVESGLPDDPSSGLAWLMADAVEGIEDFRADEGRLPSVGEAAALLDEGVSYAPSEDGYTLVLDEEDVTLTYESSMPLELWLELEGAVATVEGA